MGRQGNRIMSDKKWTGITYSFTQPYPAYSWGMYPNEWVYNNQSKLDAIEKNLEAMLTFPDAERIIRKIQDELSK